MGAQDSRFIPNKQTTNNINVQLWDVPNLYFPLWLILGDSILLYIFPHDFPDFHNTLTLSTELTILSYEFIYMNTWSVVVLNFP